MTSATERRGRVTLLQKISNWKLMVGACWIQIQNTYAHIIRKIENHEISWSVDFNRFEKHIYEKVNFKLRNKINENLLQPAAQTIRIAFVSNFRNQRDAQKNPLMEPWLLTSGTLRDRTSKRRHSEANSECPCKEL